MGPMILVPVPKEMEQVITLNELMTKIKIWKLETVLNDSLELIFHRYASLHNVF